MGQVPRAKTWLLVGDGRLASHLSFHPGRLGIPCARVLPLSCSSWRTRRSSLIDRGSTAAGALLQAGARAV